MRYSPSQTKKGPGRIARHAHNPAGFKLFKQVLKRKYGSWKFALERGAK